MRALIRYRMVPESRLPYRRSHGKAGASERLFIHHLSLIAIHQDLLLLQAAQPTYGAAQIHVVEPFWIEACFSSRMPAPVMLSLHTASGRH